MKFDVDDKNRCRLVCVKFHLNRCRFAVAVAKCLGGSFFGGTQCTVTTTDHCHNHNHFQIYFKWPGELLEVLITFDQPL